MNRSVNNDVLFGYQESSFRSGLSLMVTICVLLFNSNTTFALSIGCAIIGFILLIVDSFQQKRTLARMHTYLILFIVFGLLSSTVMNVDFMSLCTVLSRLLCGVVWILWLRTQMDWNSLRRILSWLRTPEIIVTSLDHAVLHGFLRNENGYSDEILLVFDKVPLNFPWKPGVRFLAKGCFRHLVDSNTLKIVHVCVVQG